MKRRYLNMIHQFDVEIFGAIFHIEDGLQREDFVKVLVALNKYFPSYLCSGSVSVKDGSEQIKWEDLILEDYDFFEKSYIDLNLKIPVYILNGNKLERIYTSNQGLSLTYEKDERFGFVLVLDVLSNVYVDMNYYSYFDKETHKRVYELVDQSLAAAKNRKTLADFLKELELLLGSEIIEFESAKINRRYLYKYGIKEDAVLDDFPG